MGNHRSLHLFGRGHAESRPRSQSAISHDSKRQHRCGMLLKPVHNETVTCLSTVRSGLVISGGKDAMVALINYETGDCLRKWIGHRRDITKVAHNLKSDRHFLVSSSRDLSIRLWDFNENQTQALLEYTGHELPITGLALVNDCKNIISGSRDNTVKLWDTETGKCIADEQIAQNLVTHIAPNKATNIAVQASEDKELKIWDVHNFNLVFALPKKQYIQTYCDISKDGLYCLSCSNGFNSSGCELTLWDLRQRRMIREYFGHEQTVNAAFFLKQKQTSKSLLLSVSTDHTVKLWDMEEGKCHWSEPIPSGGSLLAGISYNDGSVVVGGQNSCLCHLTLQSQHGRLYLHNQSMQIQPNHSKSFDFG